jgi:beta-lactamase superfamily II metal-dependent hydrolase
MGRVFQLEMLPAGHGDCLLLSYGTDDALRYVLIDGGPPETHAVLAERLKTVPSLELLVVSHIDNDHIGGIVKLLSERDGGLPTCREFWFNGWTQIEKPLRGIAGAPRHATDDARRPNRSPLEGHHLGARVVSAGGRLNHRFGGAALCIDDVDALPTIEFDGGLTLTLLSPNVAKLRALRAAWDRWLARLRLDANDDAALTKRLEADRRYRGEAAQALTAESVRRLAESATELDDAAANGSSIAFVAEYAGRRVALLGDAHADLLEASMRRCARMHGEARLRLDAFKLAHHGSSGNVTKGLLEAVECRRFLVSTNGRKFSHPDEEAIARLLQHCGRPLEVRFNYRSNRTQPWESAQADLGITAHLPPDAAPGAVIDLMTD